MVLSQRLINAIGSKDRDAIRNFIDDAPDHEQFLNSAVYRNMIEVVEVLLESGVSTSSIEDVVLHTKIIDGYVDMIKLLLDHGLDIGCYPRAMEYCIICKNLPIMKMFVAYGADVHKRNNREESLLELAKNSQNPEMVQFLTDCEITSTSGTC